MAETLTWSREDARLILRGELDQETVGALWKQRNAAMSGVTIIDLNAVERVDTSGLAMLLHLVHIGQQGGNRINLDGISDKLTTLAKLYNLPADLLPVTTS